MRLPGRLRHCRKQSQGLPQTRSDSIRLTARRTPACVETALPAKKAEQSTEKAIAPDRLFLFVAALLEEDGADLEYFSFYLGASRPEDGELYQWLDHDENPYGTALNDPSNPMYGCWAIGEPELQSGSGKQYTCTAFTWSGTEKRWIWYTTNPDFNPHSTVFIIEFPHDGG